MSPKMNASKALLIRVVDCKTASTKLNESAALLVPDNVLVVSTANNTISVELLPKAAILDDNILNVIED